ncbi:carbohydrate ABC transporter permease [Paenibacillus sp. MSJ-34]|uniref:carbohydrate ABC transporter permease n=1 Tax=Paenibacillus sp. MSJ-34 TaxID=2841529 RepID=UPI001C120283|nr:carbohydrate ABC transporter permease [Paenibacillus sp. MSJ-34]MBU5444999.1 carbohydrate ABC transporter permease [Paenibacillus sp. MSJ-34]
MKNVHRLSVSARHVIAVVLTIVMLYPIVWLISSSLKESSQVFVQANSLIPQGWHFENYAIGWKGFGGVTFTTFYRNTLFVVILATVGSVISSTIVAYGFARVRFRGKKLWFICMLLTLMLPGEITMVPQYIMFNWFGWINTYWPLIFPTFFGTPFFIFLIMQFIRTIPYELDEAATIDGCNRFMVFYRIIIPLVMPAMMTSAIFSFYWRWDDFMGPLIYLSSPSKYTVSLALKMFADPEAVSNWGAMFAMMVVSLIPVMLVFFFFQKYIVEGISTSGLKG